MKKIAIVRLSALGDVIVSASMLGGGLEALRSKYGDVQIEWFVDERFAEILRNSPCVAHLHALPFKKWLKSPRGIYKIWRYMRSCGEYDIAIDMQGLLKSALVGKALRARRFVGFSARGCRERVASAFYTHKVDMPYDANILARNFALFASVLGDSMGANANKDLEALESAIMESPQFQHFIALRRNSFDIDMQKLQYLSDDFANPTLANPTPCVNSAQIQTLKFLFILEASIAAKTYPIAQYCELAEILRAHYPNIAIYIIWHSDEAGAESLRNALESRQIRTIKLPHLDFNHIKFVLKNMDMVIGGDTGITHLAWAVGARSIVLLGNAPNTSGKNMSKTRLRRVLLGNPFVLSDSGEFEIASIAPNRIFECIKAELGEKRG